MNPPPPEPSKPTSAETPSSNALKFSKRQLVFAFGIAGVSDSPDGSTDEAALMCNERRFSASAHRCCRSIFVLGYKIFSEFHHLPPIA